MQNISGFFQQFNIFLNVEQGTDVPCNLSSYLLHFFWSVKGFHNIYSLENRKVSMKWGCSKVLNGDRYRDRAVISHLNWIIKSDIYIKIYSVSRISLRVYSLWSPRKTLFSRESLSHLFSF